MGGSVKFSFVMIRLKGYSIGMKLSRIETNQAVLDLYGVGVSEMEEVQRRAFERGDLYMLQMSAVAMEIINSLFPDDSGDNI
jgi:hypothetical protein